MTQAEDERKLRELCAAVDNALFSEETGETDYERLADRAAQLVDHIRSFHEPDPWQPRQSVQPPRLYNFIDI